MYYITIAEAKNLMNNKGWTEENVISQLSPADQVLWKLLNEK